MNPRNFFAELKRRRVYRVAVAYGVVTWLLIQVAAVLFSTFAAPSWVMKASVTAVVLGFPVALVLAWAFELTPEGIRLTEEGSPNESLPRNAGRKFIAIIALLAASAAGLVIFQFARSKPSPSDHSKSTSSSPAALNGKSIAVLPFENMSADKENAFFADGVQDEILTDLAKVADLKVISRTSVMSYRGAATQRNLPEIARALGVANILEGSVQRAGSRVRVTAQLIDARTDAHLWAEKYDRDLVDVFAIQSEIAQAIVTQLRAKLSPRERAAMKEPSTSDLEAYDLYLRAKELQERSLSNVGSRGNLNLEAVKLLQQATTRDPGFVRAWCQLARAHDNLYWFKNDPTPARRAMADAAVEAAARLQPESGEVHLARAWHAYWGYRNFDLARKELTLALRQLPNRAEAYELAGYIDRREGREDDSNRNLQRALELDPRNIAIVLGLRNNYTRQRRYADAAKLLDGVLAWKPEDVVTQYERARLERTWRADTRPLHAVLYGPSAAAILDDIALQRMSLAFYERDYDAAEQALAASPQTRMESNGYVRSRAWYEGEIASGRGDREKARTWYAAARLEAATALAQRPDDPKALMILAQVDAALGNKAEAMRGAERAVDLTKGKDDLDRVSLLEKFAHLCILTGEKSRALDLLEYLAKTPSGLSYGDLRLDSDFDPLRKEPRFVKVLALLAPKDASP